MTDAGRGSVAALRLGGIVSLPGVRTLRSGRFRVVVAALLLMVGGSVLGLAMVRQASTPDGQFGIDFEAYYGASVALAAGGTPYAPEMLAGPFDAQGAGRYLYPPPLAQALTPLTLLPEAAAATIFLLIQAAAVLAATLLALRLGGGALRLESVLWCGVACTFFLPVFDTLWKGNVSGFLALVTALVAVGGVLAGASVAGASLIKVAPIAYVPAVIASGRRAAIGLLAVAAALVSLSFVLAPGAWRDYAIVLPNLLAGSADQATNIAPWAVLDRLGAPDLAVTATRLVSLAAVAAAILLSVVAARRSGGMPAAASLSAVAMLLLPAALWYHYLAALLPVAALAWTRSRRAGRVLMVAGGVLVAFGLVWLALSLVGAILLMAAALPTLWPRRDPVGRLGQPAPTGETPTGVAHGHA